MRQPEEMGLVSQIQKCFEFCALTDNVSRLPPFYIYWLAHGVVPHQLPAAVEGNRGLVVADAKPVLKGADSLVQEKLRFLWKWETHVVEELAVLGCPADLHDAGRADPHLPVPRAGVHGEGAADALERGRVAAGLKRTKKLK